MSAYAKNMTEGSEIGHIVKFALPLLAGNLFQQLYNIVDSVIVGKYLGYNALAAVGATGSMTYFFYTLCIGLAAGIGILISQSYGAKKYEDVKKLIANSAYVLAAFGIIISVISMLCTEPLLRLLDTPDSIFQSSAAYMKIACAGTVAVAAYNWITAVMRSLGDSKTPLVFLIIASILNALLDLLFVPVLGLGVTGAAWATVTAQAVSAAASIIFALCKNDMFRLSRDNARYDKNIAVKCIRTGVPIALQNSMISVSMIFLQRVTNSFGDTVIAAYTATMRVEQLIQQPFSSLNMALSTFTGQNIGAAKKERVIRGYRRSVLVTLGFSVLMTAVFMLFSENIIGFFVDEPAVIEIGGKALKLSSLFYFFLGMIHTTRGLLNGAGDVGYAMVNGFVEVIGRIGFALILINIPAVGIWAVWGTSCLTWFLTALMSVIRYLGGKWRKKALV